MNASAPFLAPFSWLSSTMSFSFPESEDSWFTSISDPLLLTLKGLTLEVNAVASIFFIFASPPNLLGALC